MNSSFESVDCINDDWHLFAVGGFYTPTQHYYRTHIDRWRATVGKEQEYLPEYLNALAINRLIDLDLANKMLHDASSFVDDVSAINGYEWLLDYYKRRTSNENQCIR